MKMSIPQLILAFESPASSKDRLFTLRVFNDEQEYFKADRHPAQEFKVKLPHAFQETALMDTGSWRQRPRPVGPSRDLGQRMWANLPPSVRADVLSGTDDSPRRVAILSSACGVDDIPWEWLNTGGERYVAADDAVRFVRLVPTLYPAPPMTVESPVRVLIVIPNPKNARMLIPDEEIRIISQGLTDNDGYSVRVLVEPRIATLRKELELSPHIIHYIGHAGISGAAGNLILHDEKDGTRWLPAAEAARHLPSTVRLLCLSTCVTTENYQTGGLAKFAHCQAEIPLPTTITNQYALGPAGAESFWKEFYKSLLARGGDVVEAFHRSRRAALENDPDPWLSWASFSLVVRDGTGRPFRFAEARQRPEDSAAPGERYAAEVQAQWSARLANTLAVRMRSLDADAQRHWEKTLADETARAESFERDIEKH